MHDLESYRYILILESSRESNKFRLIILKFYHQRRNSIKLQQYSLSLLQPHFNKVVRNHVDNHVVYSDS